MITQANITEAKAKLFELVARAEAGEEVVIARAGKPVVALVPLAGPGGRPRPAPTPPREPDLLQGLE